MKALRSVFNARKMVFAVFAAFVFALIPSGLAHAAPYGDGPYGSCAVQADCAENTTGPQVDSPPGGGTIAKTSGGLDVVINLNDGQVIPYSGYTVIVSPLTPDQKGIEQVTFYLDGQLITTVEPDADGNTRWQWDVSKLRGSRLKIVVYGVDGSSVTKEFTVSVQEQPLNSAGTTAVSSAVEVGVLSGVINFTLDLVRKLPKPIAIGLPYMLLGILLAIIALLYWQSQREAREIRRIEISLQHSRKLSEEKHNLIQLTSHYLRTPVTVIRGGVDMLQGTQDDNAAINQINRAVNELHNGVEGLLGNSSSKLQNSASSSAASIGATWLRGGFWLPVALIGLLIVGINYLISNAGELDVTFMSLLTQTALFTLLCIMLYLMIRSRQLTRNARRRADDENRQQLAVEQTRNAFIRDSVKTLTGSLRSIETALPALPNSKATSFITDGCQRTAELLGKFRDASEVKPLAPGTPFGSVTVDSLLQSSASRIEEARQRGITVQTTGDTLVTAQQPLQISKVLESLIDNAVAYSKSGSKIEIRVTHDETTETISVRDYGEGIPPGKLRELFQPFARVSTSIAVDHPGIGFSLYLDRLVMASLRGLIRIESQPGSGTTATISFPSK